MKLCCATNKVYIKLILYTTDLLTISSVWSFAVPPIKYVLNYKECNSSSVFYVSVFSTLFLLLFNILFSVFFYLCIWSFVNSIWLFLNLLHESTCGTMSSRKVLWDWIQKRGLNEIRWDWICIISDWIQIRWDWIYVRCDWL